MSLLSMTESFRKSINDMSPARVESAAGMILGTINGGGCVYACGNGGSGANANLFAAAASKLIKANGAAARFISLNANMSVITSECLNYNKVFRQQLESMAYPSDLLIAFSGSGNSPNILEAIDYAKKAGVKTIGLTGMGGGRLSSEADFDVIVNSDSMEEIESVHTVIIHAVLRWLGEKLNTS
ncbi:phosphoheptose isomerase [Anaerobacterium chartisolvens]|uniref:Phosphoheptose isomerase n=1 Tax=Anaerobacterium chartisolvens TaxID=1297424 RepID=A0A369AYL8_9FIRM|nr:SIS domain-containing protein [Anaerobacterium chartisolvens]RCX12544.1 phosphoheptose isomerase [Anaerobacterium chartisolvens]